MITIDFTVGAVGSTPIALHNHYDDSRNFKRDYSNKGDRAGKMSDVVQIAQWARQNLLKNGEKTPYRVNTFVRMKIVQQYWELNH